MQKLRSVTQKLVSAYTVHKDGPGDHGGMFGYSALQEYIRVCKNYQLGSHCAGVLHDTECFNYHFPETVLKSFFYVICGTVKTGKSLCS